MVITLRSLWENTFGKISRTIATYLNLNNSNKETGHCLSKLSVILLANSGVSMNRFQLYGGLENNTVLERCLEDCISSKGTVTKILAGVDCNIY